MKNFWVLMYTKIVRAYAKARLVASPVLWWLLYKRRWNLEYSIKPKRTDIEKYLKLNQEEYSKLLNILSYRKDYLWGAIDTSVPRAYSYWFFYPLKHGRDCDDFARMWSLWGEYNNYDCTEYIIKERGKLTKAHVFSVLQKDGFFYLGDYTLSGPYNSLLAVKEDIIHRYKYTKAVVVPYEYRKELF